MIDKNELLIQKIDIDVSDCMYLDGNYCPNHDTKCELVDNCYFRKYKLSCEYEEKYENALEEIEEYVKSQFDGFGNDVYAMNKVAIKKILDIIIKAKGEGNE